MWKMLLLPRNFHFLGFEKGWQLAFSLFCSCCAPRLISTGHQFSLNFTVMSTFSNWLISPFRWCWNPGRSWVPTQAPEPAVRRPLFQCSPLEEVNFGIWASLYFPSIAQEVPGAFPRSRTPRILCQAEAFPGQSWLVWNRDQVFVPESLWIFPPITAWPYAITWHAAS